jgi:hypothetical protein
MTGWNSGGSVAATAARLRVPSLTACSVMLVLLGGVIASAADVAALVAPLLAARERGALGSVEGRAYEEGKLGGAQATPYESVAMLLLPRSADFEAELTAIKARSRDSTDAYIEAEPKVSAARLAFQRELIDKGAGHLILSETSDASGVFRFQRVPEGAWTLLAWRETAHANKRPATPKRSEAPFYKTRPQVFGQTTVVFWWIPVTVKAGEGATVRLHDRNEWLTAVREDRRVPDGDQPITPRKQQGAAPR